MTEKIDIRQKFLGSKNDFKNVAIKWNGHDILVRELKAGQRGDVFKKATVIRQKKGETFQEIDNGALSVWAVIYCCYYSDGRTRIFDSADYEALRDMPSSVLDKLAKPALELLGEDKEETVKN